MDKTTALRIAQRFAGLGPQQRRQFLDKMQAQGVSFEQLPIPPGEPAAEGEPLSYAQQRLWFLWQLEPQGSAYNMPLALRLHGPLQLPALRSAFAALLQRHAVLRSVFRMGEAGPRQVLRENVAVDLAVQAVADEAQLRAAVEHETARPFDLQEGPLLRTRLLRLEEQEHVLVITQHHIVSDGWSMRLLVDELLESYAAFAAGRLPELAEPPIRYADYAAWQRRWMEAGEGQRQLDYWRERLGEAGQALELPLDRPRPRELQGEGRRLGFQLPAELVQALERLARAEGATLFALLLAGFQALLHRYSGQEDIRVGVPVANRSRVEVEGVLGFFVNTLVLRAQVQGSLGFRQLLAQVRDSVVGAQAHQDLPFEQVVEALQAERSLERNPLFQVMFNHQQAATSLAAPGAAPGGLRLEMLEWENVSAQFDLTLNTESTADGGLAASLIYPRELFDEATIERLAGDWQRLLEAAAADPQVRIGELPLLAAEERQATLQRWNGGLREYPVADGLATIVAGWAARTPDAVAASLGEARLTYAELNARANRLARHLATLGVTAEVRVGIALPRTLDMLVALLATLKAGGAYVPLDPDYPAERLAYLAQDSGIGLVLGDAAAAALPWPAGVRLLRLDELEASLAQYSTDNLPPRSTPDNLAYVIYTSGSTGKPKGALLSQRNVLRLFSATRDWFGFDAGDVWTMFHSYAFDFSVWEIFGALLHGGRLVLVPFEVSRSPEDFLALLRRERVSVLNQTPSAFRQLLPLACAAGDDLALRYVVFGGEALEIASLRPWFERFGERRPQLVNMYGITETTVHVTYRPLGLADLEGGASSPIGEMIPDLGGYVLDADLNPVPRGCIGELHVGHAGLARGYHQRAALTAERFVPNPFAGDGSRLYRSGDLARYRADGVLDYIGRIDHQVKIRGFRIELGEIEARLLCHPALREAVVLAQDATHGKQLAAYLVPRDASLVQEGAEEARQALRQALKAHLLETLPEYMVPAQMHLLPVLPLTTNGKLDRKALPSTGGGELRQAWAAPQNEAQARLAQIWASVLGLDRVGLDDNFFELGGDSIISIQVVSRARQAGLHFTPRDLFRHQSVRALAEVARAGAETAPRAVAEGELPLLPIQRWFFELPLPVAAHWNQSLLLRAESALDGQALERALAALVEQHDALRLGFVAHPQWHGVYRDAASQRQLQRQDPLLWRRQARDAAELEALCTAAQASLRLDGQLLRALLVDMADGSQRLLLAIHHLLVDGVSWRILLEDLQGLYQQQLEGQPAQLPPRTSSLQDWHAALQGYASGAAREQLDYWRAQLDGAPAGLPGVPAELPPGALDGRLAASACTRLDAEATRQLLQDAPGAYRTQVNDLLLCALARVVTRWSGEPSMLVQLEGHGREDLFDGIDLTRSLGWFTSLFPLCLSVPAEPGAAIRAVRDQLRAVPDKGLGFGALRYLGDARAQAELAALPAPRITFNYLGQLDRSLAAQGPLQPAGESPGAERAEGSPLDNWLAINGQVYGGELHLYWTYSSALFDAGVVEGLAASLEDELRALLEHCLGARGQARPEDFPLAGLDQAALDALPLELARVEDIYPLSPMQKGMLFHSLEDSEPGLYVNQLSIRVDGLDPARFAACWQQACARHAILRSGFLWQAGLGEPLQFVLRQAPVPIREVDCRAAADAAAQVAELAAQDCAQGFDFAAPPLQRITLARLEDDAWQLIWTSHHILLDGWSSSQLVGEVLGLYAGETLPAPRGRYADYIGWLQRLDAGQLQRFWRERLAQLDEPCYLAPGMAPRPEGGRSGHAAIYSTFDAPTTRRLQAFAQAQRVTANTLVQAAWLLLLQRHTGQASVAFGATVAGRPAALPGAENLLGLFINTVPVIQRIEPTQRVGDWLRQLQHYNVEAREHEQAPLHDIQRWAGQGGQPLFDSLVVFENYPLDRRLQEAAGGGLRFGESNMRDVTHFPMDLAVHLGETLSIEFLYLRQSFADAGVLAIRRHFEHLLLALLEDAGRALGCLGLEPPPGIRALPQETPAALLPRRIGDWAARQPQATALVCAGQRMSYAELDRRSSQLAHWLRARGIGPEARVGVALERSCELLVSLLAVLKAGAAYVPLDLGYPAERLAFLVRDSAMALLLTRQALGERLSLPEGLARADLDALQAELDALPAQAPVVQLHEDNLAYLIYTSGSTGTPKGVAVAHGPIARHCRAIGALYELDERTCELHFLSFAFDGAHERWLSVLGHGGSLLLRDEELWTPAQTLEAMREHRVDVACFPPAYLLQLAEEAERQGWAPPVGTYCFGGDAVAEASFERAKRALRPRRLVNGYGPTETVVTPLLWRADGDAHCDAAYAPIGRGVGPRRLRLLDGDLNALPAGVAGELYLGGAYLARGYLDRPALTAERFVPDPFGNGERLYRSGDLVRERDDGLHDYLGRLDHQVKIRGFRIELGEIEAALRALETVRDAAVIARDGEQGRQLLGYAVAPAGSEAGLLAALRQRLPEYMLPARLLCLERLPLLPNGKLDRQALPAPEAASERAYLAPRNDRERRLAAIWAEILGVERVGLDDNFFELGGDSLQALKVIARVRQAPELGLELRLRDLMQKPSIGALCGQAREQDLNPLLALNGAGAEATLFCLHAGFGTVFDYEPLARALEGSHPVQAVQCRMLLSGEWTDDSLEGMAIDYAQYIRQQQPRGPYHLFGWSLGGTLATLVAAELERQGQEVAFLGLLDSYVPGEEGVADGSWQDDLEAFLGVVLGLPPGAAEDEAPPSAAPQAAEVARRTAAALARANGDSAYAALGADELARVFLVAWRLKQLSLALPSLPATRAATHCWWATQRQIPLLPGRQALHEAIDAGHFELPRHPRFIAALRQALASRTALA
ncbi:amino acid adenylation domain-containing protein [Pseudomonas citronellolis]|uniref:amino acid adenylation domain-containing protein n=1 Tax=Pseudomonas citronellolis TaxID=53408 RepID=UPI003C2D590A